MNVRRSKGRNQESYPKVRVVFAEARLTSENVHCLELVGCPKSDPNLGRHFPHPAMANLLWTSKGTEAGRHDKSKRSSLRPFKAFDSILESLPRQDNLFLKNLAKP